LGHSDRQVAALSSGGLILFNAAASYELIAPGHGLDPLSKRFSTSGAWKPALDAAFRDAWNIDYEAVFHYALSVLDLLPSGPVTEHSLTAILDAVSYVSSKSGLLRLDLGGRTYHSALGKELAKSFATCYTSLGAGELLAWLCVEKWDEVVGDLACGSGTLLVSAYHRKLALAFLQGFKGTVADLHRQFVEKELWGLDAMPFAAHLTLVNLLLQQPACIFSDSHVYQVPVGSGGRLGSLDLLNGPSIVVQKRIAGPAIAASRASLSTLFSQTKLEIPRESLDVVMMNPPFTKKQLVTEVLDVNQLKAAAKKLGPGFASSGGLPVPFAGLGDLCLKRGGRLGLVLPATCLSNDGWGALRRMLLDRYNVEHIILSWAAGEPAFSENSEYRETIVVGRKTSEDNGQESPARKFTLVTHLDVVPTFAESRQIAEKMTDVRRNPGVISIAGGNTFPLQIGGKLVGEAVAIPQHLLSDLEENWYKLTSYRNPRLTTQYLADCGLVATGNAPFGFGFSKLLCPLKDLGRVGLFVKSVGSAGFAVSHSRPAGRSIPVLTTTDYTKLTLSETDAEWLFEDPTLVAKAKTGQRFTPGTGLLLVPRKTDLWSSFSVGAIVTWIDAGGSVWIPFSPEDAKTSDGKSLSPTEVAKVLGAWLHSSFGMLHLIAERQEIRGGWGDWLTEGVRERRVLNPKKLSSKQVKEVISAWDEAAKVDWPLLHTQLKDATHDPLAPRAVLDAALVTILIGRTPSLTPFYAALLHDLELLGSLMSKAAH